MLHSCLERIRTTELRIGNNETNSPVNLDKSSITHRRSPERYRHTVMVKETSSTIPTVKPA